MKTFRGYPQFYTLSSLLNSIQRGESTPNTYLIQEQLFSNRCFLKLCKIHMKTYLLESLFNEVAGLMTWNFIKKRLWHRYFTVNFLQFFKKPCLQNTSEWQLLLIPLFKLKVIHWSHFVLSFILFLLSLIIAIIGVYSESV